MRRRENEVRDRARILEILEGCSVCRLGLVDRGEAYIVPMNFGYRWQGDELSLYFHSSLQGRKYALLREAESVTFELDQPVEVVTGKHACSFTMRYRSIMGRGRVEHFTDSREKQEALRLLLAHYTDTRDLPFREGGAERVGVFRLVVTELSCADNTKGQ